MLKEEAARVAGFDGPSQHSPVHDDHSDCVLLEWFVQRHDQAAFAALVRRHGPMVLSVCRRVLRHAEDTEDAFQATFLVLARKASRLRRPELLANWLYGVAYRTAQHARERSARRHQREREAASMPSPQTDPESPSHDLGRLLDEELHRLPEKYRLPLVLCYLEGRTNKEAAAILGWPSGSMAHRLERGRDLLRDRLNARLNATPLSVSPLMVAALLRSVDVPAWLVDTTVQASVVLGSAKHVAVGLISSSVRELMEATLRSLRRGGRFWLLSILVLALLALSTAMGIAASVQPLNNFPDPVPVQPGNPSPSSGGGSQPTGDGNPNCPNHQ
jgi:RNA polymerase sigma factor (sigma-70 family)